jgi:hypothetical protein
MRVLEVPLNDLEEMFHTLDADQTGTVSAREFVTGIRRVKVRARGRDVVQVVSLVNGKAMALTRIEENTRSMDNKTEVSWFW